MKLRRSFFRFGIACIVATVLSACLAADAWAFREERRGYYGGFEREGEVVEGPRGGAAAVGPYGGEAVRGPAGNVVVGRPIGDRVDVLPDSATAVAVGDQMYYVDGSGVYYLPCADDSTVFCVVPAPQ
jgi:hypothetical protein